MDKQRTVPLEFDQITDSTIGFIGRFLVRTATREAGQLRVAAHRVKVRTQRLPTEFGHTEKLIWAYTSNTTRDEKGRCEQCDAVHTAPRRTTWRARTDDQVACYLKARNTRADYWDGVWPVRIWRLRS